MGSDLAEVAGDSARSGSFLAFGVTFATLVLSIGSIVAARLLGPDLYGQYTLVLVGPQLLFLFTDLGINQGIIKLTAERLSRGEVGSASTIIKSGLVIRILTGSLMAAILYFFAQPFAAVLLNRPELFSYLQIMSIMILAQAIYGTTVSAFVSIDRSEFSAVTTGIQSIIRAFLTILLLVLGFGLFGALVGNIIGFGIGGVFGVVVLKLVMPKKADGRSQFGNDAKALVLYGMPIFVSFLFTGFTPLYQNLILANVTTDAVIGNFKAALNFSAVLLTLSFPITTALLSGFSKLNSATASKNVKAFFRLTNKYTALVVFPIVMLFICLSSEIVQVLYGSTYESASLYLSLYCLLYFLVGLGFLNLASFYNGIGETKTTFKIGAVTFVLVGILSPIFANLFAVPGLIAAFLVANTVGTAYGALVAKSKHGVEFNLVIVSKIFLAALISAVPAVLLHFSGLQSYVILVLGSIVFFAIYLIVVPLSGIVTKVELQNGASIVNRIGPIKLIVMKGLEFELKLVHISSLIKRSKKESIVT